MQTSKSAPELRCFVHFDFEMCFPPQQRALFSSLIWPAGSAPAALANLLFDPPEPQIIGKTVCFATFLAFRAPGSSFFWDFLFFDLLSSSLLFADSSHLCFSFVHIVGSLTSKLPLINPLIIEYTDAISKIHYIPLYSENTTRLSTETPHTFRGHWAPELLPIAHRPINLPQLRSCSGD